MKLSLDTIWGRLPTKTEKKFCWNSFTLYTASMLLWLHEKNFQKNSIFKKTQKIHFYSFLYENPSTRIFPWKKLFDSVLNLHVTVTPIKQIRYVPCILICKPLKTSIWANLGHLTRKSRKNISRKQSVK